MVALIVCGLETPGLIRTEFSLSGKFWGPVAALNSNFGTPGYVIIGFFAISWIVPVLIYRIRRYDDIEVTLAKQVACHLKHTIDAGWR